MKKDILFFLVCCIAIVILLFVPTGFENPSVKKNIRYEKAKVLSVSNENIRTFSIVNTGAQELNLLIKTGKFRGDTVSANNVLIGQKKIDKIFVPGDKVFTVVRTDESGSKVVEARAADYYRQDSELLLFLCFALFLILFSKFIGLKAIVSFIFTAVSFWKLLLPMFLKGYNPILVSICIVFLTTSVIVLLVGGFNKKGLVALLGSFSGVVITAILALSFGFYFKIPGTIQDFSEALLYSGFANLDISNIFISIIFLSSAGAVMDVSMDIAAAQNELIENVPDMSRKDMIKSGFNISSPILGSMTTTLLFAYSGTFMFAFMAFMAKSTPFPSIVNTNYISAEILHTLVGSFGLVLVAPLTSIIGGFVFTSGNK